MINLAIGLRKSIGRWLNGLDRKTLPPAFSGRLSTVKKVLILTMADTEDQREGWGRMVSELKKTCPTADVSSICFLSDERKHSQHISVEGVEYTSERDFSFWFKLKNGTLTNYLTQVYDIGIFMNLGQNVCLDYISDYVKAGLRVGRRDAMGGTSNLNFMIDSSKSQVELAASISKNLSMFFGK